MEFYRAEYSIMHFHRSIIQNVQIRDTHVNSHVDTHIDSQV
jgi:hypothetical protein